jgi:hypothetical protein
MTYIMTLMSPLKSPTSVLPSMGTTNSSIKNHNHYNGKLEFLSREFRNASILSAGARDRRHVESSRDRHR